MQMIHKEYVNSSPYTRNDSSIIVKVDSTGHFCSDNQLSLCVVGILYPEKRPSWPIVYTSPSSHVTAMVGIYRHDHNQGVWNQFWTDLVLASALQRRISVPTPALRITSRQPWLRLQRLWLRLQRLWLRISISVFEEFWTAPALIPDPEKWLSSGSASGFRQNVPTSTASTPSNIENIFLGQMSKLSE